MRLFKTKIDKNVINKNIAQDYSKLEKIEGGCI